HQIDPGRTSAQTQDRWRYRGLLCATARLLSTKPPGSTPSSRNSQLDMTRHSRIPMTPTTSPVADASIATCAGGTETMALAAPACSMHELDTWSRTNQISLQESDR